MLTTMLQTREKKGVCKRKYIVNLGEFKDSFKEMR